MKRRLDGIIERVRLCVSKTVHGLVLCVTRESRVLVRHTTSSIWKSAHTQDYTHSDTGLKY